MLGLCMTEGMVRYKIRHDAKLGWHLGKSQAETLIARVKERWRTRAQGVEKEDRREEMRCRLETAARASFAAKQNHAGITALRYLAELDGLVGDVNVKITGGVAVLQVDPADERREIAALVARVAPDLLLGLQLLLPLPTNGANSKNGSGEH